MRELVVSTFLTLDGVMQAPGGPQEDPTGGFEHGGWSVNYWDEMMGAAMAELRASRSTCCSAGSTYEIFAAHWPYAGDEERRERGGTANDADDAAAAALNSARKYVASRTLDEVEWSNSTLLRGDVAEAVAELKGQDGPVLVVQGSSDLIRTLLAHDLVDEFRIWTFPVVVGEGKRLFGDTAGPAALRLVDSQVSTTGVVMAVYRRAGAVETGSFAFEEPTDAEVERRRRLAAEDRA